MNAYHLAAMARHFVTSKSSVGHGVHSPFVYNFLTEVINQQTPPAMVSGAESLRAEMLADRRAIDVTDYGIGTCGRKDPKRVIHDIAANAALSPRNAAMLARIAAAHSTPAGGVVLELGTSLGISTLCLSAAAPQNRIITVEGCPSVASVAQENLRKHKVSNVQLINAEFSDALRYLQQQNIRVGLAFIDGNHNGEALLKYFGVIMEMAAENITVVADDIHLNRSMYEGWKKICCNWHEDAIVEMFSFGILFRKRVLTPGRYKIRH